MYHGRSALVQPEKDEFSLELSRNGASNGARSFCEAWITSEPLGEALKASESQMHLPRQVTEGFAQYRQRAEQRRMGP
jgi:hypothetical protein